MACTRNQETGRMCEWGVAGLIENGAGSSNMTACFTVLCFLQHHGRCGDLLNSTASINHHSFAGLMKKNMQSFA